jgi:hypothetical protein
MKIWLGLACGEIFNLLLISFFRLQNHVDTRHSEPGYCNICLATFNSKISLYRHHMSSHKELPLSMDTSSFEFCNECGMPCLNKYALKKHLYMHKNKGKYVKKAKQQQQQQTTTTSLSQEELLITDSESYPCHLCLKPFKSKAGLDQHIRVLHQKIKAFSCHFCGKAFGYKKTLDCHISVLHENSGAFPCELCGKKFGMKSTLRQHRTSVHDKEERFKCEICEKPFSRKDYYQVHMSTVHQKNKPPKGM